MEGTLGGRLRSDPYAVAAVGYAVYGVVYLVGASLSLTPERRTVAFGFVPWWVFYVAGVALLVVLPVFVWRRAKWLTRILTLGPAGKALALCWMQGRALQAGREASAYDWFFLLVAIGAAILLFRAGWGRQRG